LKIKSKSEKSSSKRGDNTIQFKRIKKTTIPDEIIDQIHSMILTGELSPGDRLPAERQLCEMFNVGRSSIREALKTLASIGIIRRDTVGTTVCASEDGRYYGISL